MTRGGPGVLGNPSKFSVWYYFGHRQPQGAVVRLQRRSLRRDAKDSARHDIGPYMNWRADLVDRRSTSGFRYNINNDDSQWVTNEEVEDGRTRYVFGRIEQSTVGVHYARQLHDDAEPVAAGLRGAVRVAPATTRTTRSWSTAAPPDYEDRYRPYAYGEQRRLQHPLVPHDQRAALGIQARLDAVRGVAAGQVGRPASTATSSFGRDFGGVFSAPCHNVFLVKFCVLAEYVEEAGSRSAGR